MVKEIKMTAYLSLRANILATKLNITLQAKISCKKIFLVVSLYLSFITITLADINVYKSVS